MRGRGLTDDERCRRDRAQGWTIVGALVGLAVLAGLWVGASSVLRSQVEVHSSRPDCTGTRVVGQDVDARFARHDRIGPGGTVRFTLTYEFRPQGCDEGSTIWMRDQPRLFVSALGHRGEVDGHSTVAFTSTAQRDSSPGCRAADQRQ